MENAIDAFRSRMSELGLDAALVSDIDNVRWLTGFSGSSGFVILTPGGGAFITDSRYSQQSREQVKCLPVEIYKSPTTAGEAIAAAAKGLGVSKLGFEAEHVTFATHKAWAEKLNGVSLEPVSELADPLRMVKTSEEIGKIREACGIADAAFSHVLRMLQPGVTEYDVNLDIEFFIRRQGAKLAFPPIVVSGERSARPHGEASEKKLERGDFVTMDFGAMVDGYVSDLTRTIVIGEASDRHREVYNAVLEAQLSAIEAIRPGAAAKDVDAVARESLAKHDLAQYFGHGLGHCIGRVVHDVGSMSALSKVILAEGQVWTVEPGAYIEGFGGVRIEDDVVVTASGCEILTHSPKELMIL
jgi:Xaa-Pro aminopeptidase